MRNMNCRNILREIEEAAPGDLLSAAVNDHLTTCVACETFFREQLKLQELVGSLGTVAAPGDFDFRLRARLAREKRGAARPLALGNLSFGFRSAAVATILVVIGATLVFVSLRTRSDNAVSEGVAGTVPNEKPASPVDSRVADSTDAPKVAAIPNPDHPGAVDGIVKSPAGPPAKQRGSRQTVLATLRDNRVKTRDLSSTAAGVLKRDQLAEAYPSSAFPINASYQSLKVSVDDGRGSSRTISLPTVSFGSQRALSQSASPLMASARGAW